MSIGQKLKNTNMLEAILNTNSFRYHIKRTTDFFAPCDYNLDPRCTDLQFELQGYSLFQPEIVLRNFIGFFMGLTEYTRKEKIILYTVKITISGFTVKEDLVGYLVKGVQGLQENLKTLWIHTNDLENVTLEDFMGLFRLMTTLGSNSSKNFQDYSLQCANWSFKQRQPTFKEVQKVLKSALQDSFGPDGERINQGMSGLCQKRIRLQLSGWWYRIAQAKAFLNFTPSKDQLKQIEKKKHESYTEGQPFTKQQFNKQVQIFHSTMFLMINNMLDIMSEIECLEIDMRNNHESLQMKKLKEKIISGAMKEERSEKSIISMRQTHVPNANKEEEKSFRLNVMM